MELLTPSAPYVEFRADKEKEQGRGGEPNWSNRESSAGNLHQARPRMRPVGSDPIDSNRLNPLTGSLRSLPTTRIKGSYYEWTSTSQ